MTEDRTVKIARDRLPDGRQIIDRPRKRWGDGIIGGYADEKLYMHQT